MATAFVRLLGAVRFVDERSEVVDLPSAAQRRLLAALALASGATQRSEYLCDARVVVRSSRYAGQGRPEVEYRWAG